MSTIRKYPHVLLLLRRARFTTIQPKNDVLKNLWKTQQSPCGNFATHAICFNEQSSNLLFLKKRLTSTDAKNDPFQRRYLFHVFLARIKSSFTLSNITHRTFEYKLFRFVNTKNQSCKAATVLFHLKSTLATPRKPLEPEYCCMGGCVECVWDIYAKELKAWDDYTKRLAIDKRPLEQVVDKKIDNATGVLQEEKKKREPNVERDILTEKIGTFNSQAMNQTENTEAKSSSSTRNSTTYLVVEDGDISQQEDNDKMLHDSVGIREFMKLEKRLRKGK